MALFLENSPYKTIHGHRLRVWLIGLMESIAKPGTQVTLTELEQKCGWITITGWNPMETVAVLNIIENKGILSVDRQMNPWIFKAKDLSENLWPRTYEDLFMINTNEVGYEEN